MSGITAFLLALVLSFAMAGTALATAQVSDVLIVDGKEEPLNTNPLSPWLAANTDRRPRFESPHTANWRGYVATWEIAGGQLWLRKVDGYVRNGTRPHVFEGRDGTKTTREIPNLEGRDVLPEMFDGRKTVVAEWYTGTLIVPRGEIVDYVHMGYGSTFERYTIIWIRSGQVLRRLDLDAAQFAELKRERFEAYKETAEYRAHLDRIGADRDPGFTERFLFDFATEQYLSMDPELKD